MILRDTVVEVDLRAIGANMDAICQMVGPDVAVMPVVKACLLYTSPSPRD